MTPIDRPRLAVRSPADLIAAVPYLIGFHPVDSVVVVALRGRQIVFAARADLPDQGADPLPPARHLAEVVGRQRAEAATVLGYGPPARVTGSVDAVRAALTGSGLLLLDALRVADGRYWSYLCTETDCCPPEGTPYDARASEVSATAVFAGQVALPDRAALTAQVAPVDGPARAAMGQATDRAEQRLVALMSTADTELPDDRALRSAGRAAVRAAQRRQRRGESLTDDEVAWLGLLLTHLPVRDHAWERTDGRDEDIALWSDVLRRTESALSAAPASLLAFAAWRAGQGALAAVTLERALVEHPDYSLALLLDDVLRRGIPPSELDGWPTVASAALLRPRQRRPRRT
ncbi:MULTISPECIES: DUF4192 domain-containing protein [Micromonospora]|uniref:DUF4192 domain-containing protein n=1 Tax=Micromonospora yangpuensis TaxID=683228 RepID=A0A1C6TVN8_9ACTN|nr:DUF4192 domain-containing protein [Micromonospora yangpuensis]GGM00567.1 hypothetical protein GCM10012279_17700 [Micromonospora yangpuensis]SCL45882.1 protein of unknown function [Micromonospora yangpuensis]